MTQSSTNIARVSAKLLRDLTTELHQTTLPDPAVQNARARRSDALDSAAELAKSLDEYAPAFEATTTEGSTSA